MRYQRHSMLWGSGLHGDISKYYMLVLGRFDPSGRG
jgi:hypothetical protein